MVGAGPVGLFLAGLLARRGWPVRVFERNEGPREDSRSIGIHPPSLERFAAADLAESFLDAGLAIRRGIVYDERGRLSTLTFEGCRPPFPYVLAIPQADTERILLAWLQSFKEATIEWGVTVDAVRNLDDGVAVSVQRADGAREEARADSVFGCDGARSVVRGSLGISFEGTSFPDRFVMGDIPDHGEAGRDAWIVLANEGLLESFPLPNGCRRWVAMVDGEGDPDEELTAGITRRTRYRPNEEPIHVSRFQVQSRVADRLVVGRAALVGDAGHVMSPFGGQGMNVGWLNAWDLVELRAAGRDDRAALARYDARALRRARRAVRRAERNLRIGRPWRMPAVRNGLLRFALSPGIRRLAANYITMRWL